MISNKIATHLIHVTILLAVRDYPAIIGRMLLELNHVIAGVPCLQCKHTCLQSTIQ